MRIGKTSMREVRGKKEGLEVKEGRTEGMNTPRRAGAISQREYFFP
jgi:hypothetical protein